jgi:hypothetical protein
MTMTASEKVQRSQTLKFVQLTAPQFGVEIVDQFSKGGRALLGKRDGELLVWLESDGLWHTVGPALGTAGF